MGFKSLGESNKNYEVDGIIFPTRFIFTMIESIDRNLKFIYTLGTVENDFEPIFYSEVREDAGEFSEFLARAEDRISRIENIDDGSTKQFLYKEKCDGEFFAKFSGIYCCLIEGACTHPQTQNYFERRILDIARRMYFIGIGPPTSN